MVKEWNRYCGHYIFFRKVGRQVVVYATLQDEFVAASPEEKNTRTGWFKSTFESMRNVRRSRKVKPTSDLEFIVLTGHSVEGSLERDREAGHI